MTNSPTDAIEKLIEWHTDRLGLELRAQAKQARDQLERLKEPVGFMCSFCANAIDFIDAALARDQKEPTK